jgi:signal recognition particle subunit SRP54
MEAKLSEGNFNLEDFLDQMQQVKKMGSLGKYSAMLPGAGALKGAELGVDEKQMGRVEAIIRSMTPKERRDPDIINGSRSGASRQAVERVLKRLIACSASSAT